MLRQARATLLTVPLFSLIISFFYYTSSGALRRSLWVLWQQSSNADPFTPISHQCYDTPPLSSASSQVLNGPPTTHFRDNLRNDTNYITAWSNAGFTNQFMGYVNMIYLSTITDRVPIIPPFAPAEHISASAGIIPFGDIFDLEHLRHVLRTPILEWRDVKILSDHNSPEIDHLGCWSTRNENARDPNRAENLVHHLGLDVSYTRVPRVTRKLDENHVVFSQLAATIYPVHPLVSPLSLPRFATSPLGHSSSPDEKLSCFDFLYYVTSGVDLYEWRFSWSPAWQTIARHLKFTQPMLDLSQEYLRRAFLIHESDNELPPFIAVHIRRGDFAYQCSADRNPECFPPLSVYKKHVDEIMVEIQASHDIEPHALQVLVMSDEVSPDFWEEVRNEGWFHINHTTERTLERLGEWYPPLIDVVSQSQAVGFVGTEDSTFSLMGQRRVEDWNGGVTRSVNLRTGF